MLKNLMINGTLTELIINYTKVCQYKLKLTIKLMSVTMLVDYYQGSPTQVIPTSYYKCQSSLNSSVDCSIPTTS